MNIKVQISWLHIGEMLQNYHYQIIMVKIIGLVIMLSQVATD